MPFSSKMDALQKIKTKGLFSFIGNLMLHNILLDKVNSLGISSVLIPVIPLLNNSYCIYI